MRVLAISVLVASACQFTEGALPASRPPDAAEVVAIDSLPVFDPARCPAGYVVVPGQTSRYRWNTVENNDLRTFASAQAHCANDASVSTYPTHLIVLDTSDERDAVWQALGIPQNSMWTWTGTFQRGDTWYSITGGTHTPSWAPANPKPRGGMNERYGVAIGFDGGGNAIPSFGDLNIPLSWKMQVACECDGLDATDLP